MKTLNCYFNVDAVGGILAIYNVQPSEITKKNKSMLSILGVLFLSLALASGASASASKPHYESDGGGGSSKPPSCVKAPCPIQ